MTPSHSEGDVYLGLVKNQDPLRANQAVHVAVKCSRLQGIDIALLEEAAIMAQFRHPNVVAFYGVVVDESSCRLVIELCENGSLDVVLRSQMLHQNGAPTIAVDTGLKLALDVAQGMSYLESRSFIHRDLAARNILVSSGATTAKISDFGLSRSLGDGADYYRIREDVLVPIRWSAPEVLLECTFSSKADVWSYGRSKSLPSFSPRICSRTLMGFSRDGSTLPCSYADGRSPDDVIAF